jgi:arabinofuranan 3-O-arabinosyltransferase
VASGPADVLSAVGAGLVGPEQAAIVPGDSAATGRAQIVGDGYQLRERQFGRVHGAEGTVLAPGEPRHAVRRVENYPGSPGSRPVVARYHGIRYVDASTSQGYVGTLGPVRPEEAPYAAVDGDPKTGWTTGYATRPSRQWLDVHYDRVRAFGQVRIHGDADPARAGVLRWRVSVGGHTVLARTDTTTGVATADLGGARGRTLRLAVDTVGAPGRRAQIAIREVEATGLPVERSLVIPPVRTSAPTAYVFRSTPETRPCVPTLLAPDCDPNRYRPAEEAAGIDRDVTFDRAGTWTVTGTVVARADPATMVLLDPLGARVTMHGSSTYFDDPTVSSRMAYDANPATSWIADPREARPTLTVDFARPRRIARLAIVAPAAPAVAPRSATLVSGSDIRQVDLGGFGTFDPLVTRHVEIIFHNPTRRGRPIGLGDLRLGSARNSIPFDGSASTGAVCGFGPNVYVDGRRHLTRVDGLIGDVSSSGPLSFSVCDGPVKITNGPHRVRIASTAQFQPVRVVLAEPGAFEAATATSAGSFRSLRLLEESATTRRAVLGAGGEALLVTRGNWNRGWTASLDGRTLRPQRIDGWAQGWRVPAGKGGRLSVQYRPQDAYVVGLVGGLAVAGTMLLLAIIVLLRTRLRPSVEPRLPVRGRRRGGRRLVGRGALVVAGYVFAGLPGLVGAGLAQAPGPRRVRLTVAALLVAAGSLVTAGTLLRHGPGLVPDLSDVLVGVGAMGALLTGVAGDRDDAR